MAGYTLFEQAMMGAVKVKSRLVMAPMTRARSAQPGNVPTQTMAEYYAQRAGAGLIISEATQISEQGQGYSWTPGIYTPEQIAGWRGVTDRVHRAGGTIFCQLWHVGRMSHPSLHADGQTVAPSAIAPDATVWIAGDDGVGRMLECPVPRELSVAEIQAIVADYAQAAKNAIAAGFDGVEVHGANGYLIDQFLRRSANTRTDAYGGSLENRLRFPIEVLDAITQAIGRERTGIRLAPFITQRGMDDPQAIDAILALAKVCEERGLAFLHLAEADWDDAPKVPWAFRQSLRDAFSGSIIVAGNYTLAKADELLSAGLVDFVAFGRPFIANPDLPQRLQQHLPLATVQDPSTLFGGSAMGYTDYPVWQNR